MMRYLLALAAVSAAALLAACSPPTPTPLPPPAHVWTALEAYEQIRPAMLAWHDDALAVNASALALNTPAWDIRPDGRAPRWCFRVVSAKAQKQTFFELRDTDVRLGIDLQGKEVTYYGREEGLPFGEMIDSTRAVTIARDLGLDPASRLREVYVDFDVGEHGEIGPMYWQLTFADAHDPWQERSIQVDLLTGEVLGDEVRRVSGAPTPSPTPSP